MRKSHVFHRLIKFVQTTMFKNMYISVCVRDEVKFVQVNAKKKLKKK